MKDVLTKLLPSSLVERYTRPDAVEKVVCYLSTGDTSVIVRGGINEFKKGGVSENGEITTQPLLSLGAEAHAFLSPMRVRRKGFMRRNVVMTAIASPGNVLPPTDSVRPRRSPFIEDQPGPNKVTTDLVVVVEFDARSHPHESLRRIASQAREQISVQLPIQTNVVRRRG